MSDTEHSYIYIRQDFDPTTRYTYARSVEAYKLRDGMSLSRRYQWKSSFIVIYRTNSENQF